MIARSCFLLFLCLLVYRADAQQARIVPAPPAAERISLATTAPPAPPKAASGPTTVSLGYFDITLPMLTWQLPRSYSSFIMLSLLQRFTLPNSTAFLDSITLFIGNMDKGKIRFRVLPDTLVDFGTGTFRIPDFSISYDEILVDKSALTMGAFNTIRMSGAPVPKEFFVSAEFTVDSGGTNNTFILASDSRTAPRRTTENSRVVAINQVGTDLQAMMLDSVFNVSGIMVYPQLYFIAHVDTATSSATPLITTTPPLNGYTNQPWNYQIHASGVPRPYYLIQSGPPGMTIANLTGEAQWTPGSADTGAVPVVLRAINANGFQDQSFTITVVRATPPKITSAPKRLGIVNELYSYTVKASGGPPPLFSLVTPPTGMGINGTTGAISWIPNASQAKDFNITVIARNGVAADTQKFVLHIDASAVAPRITSTPKTTAIAGQPYSYTVVSTGNPPPIFTLVKFPAGMTIDPNTGAIMWLPLGSQVGSQDVQVHAENRAGTNDQSYTIVVSPPPATPVFTSTPDTLAIAGQAYTYTAAATGTPAPAFTLTASPTGMSINSATGVIAWTPARAQKGYNAVTVRANNSAGFVEQSYQINVRTTPKITSTPVTTAEVGTKYTYQATVDAYPDAGFGFTQFPAGMTVTAQGSVEWTPTANQTGLNPVTLRALNLVGSDEQQFQIDVSPATGIGTLPAAAEFRIAQSYPHPVGMRTRATVAFELPAAARVRIELRNLLGQNVATLADAQYPSGTSVVTFMPSTFSPRLSPGVYLLVLTNGAEARSRRIIVVE